MHSIKNDLHILYGFKYFFIALGDSDPKAPFSIATTLMSREGRYSFLWIAPL